MSSPQTGDGVRKRSKTSGTNPSVDMVTPLRSGYDPKDPYSVPKCTELLAAMLNDGSLDEQMFYKASKLLLGDRRRQAFMAMPPHLRLGYIRNVLGLG